MRPPRLALMLLPQLDHFAADILAQLPAASGWDIRAFAVRTVADFDAALAWTDDPARDAIWFEFCWPPFPALIERCDFGRRRVIVRVHRIEAYGTDHVARAPWHKIDDLIVVSDAMAARVRRAAPALDRTTQLHVIHNGVDLVRFRPWEAPDPFRIGWCGLVTLHKNPVLALQILHALKTEDPRYRLHVCGKGGDPVAVDSLQHLARRMSLTGSIVWDGVVPPSDMPAWHAGNAALLSTSVYESFGYAIAEAAASGCDLAILDYAGTEEFWPAAALFGTVAEAVQLIRGATSGRWRETAERFGLDRQCLAIAAMLNTQRLGSVQIAHDDWHGRFIVRDRSEHIERIVCATGQFYEAEMLRDVQARLPSGGLFVDVGANIGNHALFAAGVCDAEIIAFEPSSQLADQCAATLAANGLPIDLRLQGAGAAPMRARLEPGLAGNAGMTSLQPDPNGPISIVTLDQALQGRTPSVIKIDVEGMECDVIAGARATLLRAKPSLYVEAATDEAFAAVDALLTPLGYEPQARFNATPTWLFVPTAQAAR